MMRSLSLAGRCAWVLMSIFGIELDDYVPYFTLHRNITAVSVVHVKHAWYIAVVVIAGDHSIRSFGGTYVQKCHQVLRELSILRIRTYLYIEQAQMADVSAVPISALRIGNTKRVW